MYRPPRQRTQGEGARERMRVYLGDLSIRHLAKQIVRQDLTAEQPGAFLWNDLERPSELEGPGTHSEQATLPGNTKTRTRMGTPDRSSGQRQKPHPRDVR
jgi:hypothetical protein